MPFLVNDQIVTGELIAQEKARLAHDLSLQSLSDPAVRSARLQESAELAAINRVLIAQAAAADTRPINAAQIEAEFQRQIASGACKPGFGDEVLRQKIEAHCRLKRLEDEFTSAASPVTSKEAKAFYREHATRFTKPEGFRAAHIVRHVNETQTKKQAEAAIEAAWAELESGAGFAEVAERYSDCKGAGGELGRFDAGEMVPEFEAELRKLEPGERSGIFTTPFGFHIAYLHAKYPAEPAKFGMVRDDVIRVLTMMRKHACWLKGVDQLRAKARIVRVAESQPAPDIAQYVRAAR